MRATSIFFLIILMNIWNNESAGQIASSYFPMQIGNEWTFSVAEPFSPITPDTITQTIIDTVRTNNDLFYRFDQFGSMTNPLMRMTEDNKLVVMTQGTPQVMLDFTAAVGNTWMLPAPQEDLTWEVSLIGKTDTIIVPAGRFYDCYRFGIRGKMNDEYVIDYGWDDFYAPQVGLVQRYNFGAIVYEYRLVEAWVNGVHIFTRVIQSPRANLPNGIQLVQNYPNPFNPSTTIQYQLLKNDRVTIAIFNLQGQEVSRLADGEQAAGSHVVRWEAGNQPSGLYVCRIASGDFVESKKMMLLK